MRDNFRPNVRLTTNILMVFGTFLIAYKIGSINIPIIKAIDTTAAGDSFNGSFLAYHLKNKYLSIEEKILSSHIITKNVLKYRGAIIPKTKMKI